MDTPSQGQNVRVLSNQVRSKLKRVLPRQVSERHRARPFQNIPELTLGFVLFQSFHQAALFSGSADESHAERFLDGI